MFRLLAHTGMWQQVQVLEILGLSAACPAGGAWSTALGALREMSICTSGERLPANTSWAWLSNYGVCKCLWDAWGSRGCPSGVRGTKALLVPSSRLCIEQWFSGSPGRPEQAAGREENLLCKEPLTHEGCTFSVPVSPPPCNHTPAPNLLLLPSIPPSSSSAHGLRDRSRFY